MGKPSKPLTTEEVIAILERYGPPEPLSGDETERIVKLMKEAYKKKFERMQS